MQANILGVWVRKKCSGACILDLVSAFSRRALLRRFHEELNRNPRPSYDNRGFGSKSLLDHHDPHKKIFLTWLLVFCCRPAHRQRERRRERQRHQRWPEAAPSDPLAGRKRPTTHCSWRSSGRACTRQAELRQWATPPFRANPPLPPPRNAAITTPVSKKNSPANWPTSRNRARHECCV